MQYLIHTVYGGASAIGRQFSHVAGAFERFFYWNQSDQSDQSVSEIRDIQNEAFKLIRDQINILNNIGVINNKSDKDSINICTYYQKKLHGRVGEILSNPLLPRKLKKTLVELDKSIGRIWALRNSLNAHRFVRVAPYSRFSPHVATCADIRHELKVTERARVNSLIRNAELMLSQSNIEPAEAVPPHKETFRNPIAVGFTCSEEEVMLFMKMFEIMATNSLAGLAWNTNTLIAMKQQLKTVHPFTFLAVATNNPQMKKHLKAVFASDWKKDSFINGFAKHKGFADALYKAMDESCLTPEVVRGFAEAVNVREEEIQRYIEQAGKESPRKPARAWTALIDSLLIPNVIQELVLAALASQPFDPQK
jgi:hypothetical protein